MPFFASIILRAVNCQKLSAQGTLKSDKICPRKSVKTRDFDKNIMHFDCQ